MKLFLILSVFLTNQIFDKLNDLQVIRCKLDITTKQVVEKKRDFFSGEDNCKQKKDNWNE